MTIVREVAVSMWIATLLSPVRGVSEVQTPATTTEDGTTESIRRSWERISAITAPEPQDLGRAEKELRAFLSDEGSDQVRGAVYQHLLTLYVQHLPQEHPTAATTGQTAILELRKNAERVLMEAVARVGDSDQVLELEPPAHNFLTWLREEDPETASRLAASVYDPMIARASTSGARLYAIAIACCHLGLASKGYQACVESVVAGRCDRPGIASVAAAHCATEFTPPNWELAWRTLMEARGYDDVPDPRFSLITKAEEIERRIEEWHSNAVVADPASRVAGLLTLWQEGLYEPMVGYMSQRLWDEVVRREEGLAALNRNAVGPLLVSDIEEEDRYGDGRVRVRATLTFEEGSRPSDGRWTFDLIQEQFRGELRKRIWVVDRISPPDKGRERK